MSEVVDRLRERARAAPDSVALRTPAGAETFAQLGARIDQRVADLRAGGVRAGDVVAVVGESASEVVAVALAVRACDGVVALGPEARAADGRQAGPRWLVRCDGAGRSLTVEAAPERGVGTPWPRPPGADWLRATGGTTGVPRQVLFSDAQVLANSVTRACLLDLEPGQTVVLTAPASTSFGFWSALATLLAGATVRPVSPVSPRGVLTAARDGAAWTLTTAPVIRALARLPPVDDGAPVGVSTNGVRMLVTSAAYPGPEAELVRARHGAQVFDRYGASETGPVAQSRAAGGPLFPAPGCDLRLVGDPPVVEVTGPGVALGYAGGPPFAGTFRTADVAEIVDGGGLRLRGRLDRMIRRSGRPVDLAAIERALVALPGVERARVWARPGPLDVDVLAAVVALEGTSLDGPTLLGALVATLAPWECPRAIDVVSAASPIEPGAEKWCWRAPPGDA